jgi:tocopherol O-methyltransferase
MSDKLMFFSQAHRVLRPGGRFVVCAWLAADNPSPTAERWLLEPICREGRMPQMGTVADYERIGSTEGFTLDRHEDVTAKVARTWPTIARVFARKLASRPAYLRFLLDRHARNRIFALTVFRIWLAYRTGAMRYGVLTFTS